MARVTIDLPESFGFETEIPIRINDINYGGHLGNDSVLSLAHEARLQFLKHHGFTESDVGGCGIILSDAAIVYRSEAFYGQVVRIRLAAKQAGKTRCVVLYALADASDGREIARVKTGIVFFDYKRRRPTRIPEAFREAIFQDD